jgi:hypothetical protein
LIPPEISSVKRNSKRVIDIVTIAPIKKVSQVISFGKFKKKLETNVRIIVAILLAGILRG